jgi:ATP-dependent Clp protease ATP-binding subunit ClpA
MFERFTDRARRVVVLAQEEARGLDHNYIGTEHLLLGLIHEGEGIAAQVLDALGVSGDAVRQLLVELVGRGSQPPPGHIPYTPRGKKVLELALREALQLGHSYIGTEHLLLGVLREGGGVACQLLTKLDVDSGDVRVRVFELIGRKPHVVSDVPVVSATVPNANLHGLIGDLGRRVAAGLPVSDFARVTTEHSSGEVTEVLTVRYRR